MSDKLKSLEDLLASPLDKAQKALPSPRYRAQLAKTGFGIGEDNQLYTGLTLALIDPDDFQGSDLIEEEINNVGDEAHIILPDGGLIEGHIYEGIVVNLQRDWESGIVDDWDVKLIDVTESEGDGDDSESEGDGDDSEEHF